MWLIILIFARVNKEALSLLTGRAGPLRLFHNGMRKVSACVYVDFFSEMEAAFDYDGIQVLTHNGGRHDGDIRNIV